MKQKDNKVVKKKIKISGIVTINVNSSFNNSIITACDNSGSVIAWASSGSAGYKNTKKSTPFAAQSAAETLANNLKTMGVSEIKIAMKGLGSGREAVLKTMSGIFKVLELKDTSPVAFNGVRPSKRRRS